MAEPRLTRDASGRRFFGLSWVPAADRPALCGAVAAAFSPSPSLGSFVAGLEAVAMDGRRGDLVVEMAWDNRSGFIVTAKFIHAESLVGEVPGLTFPRAAGDR